jgi:Protein of unknown function (DUF2589)
MDHNDSNNGTASLSLKDVLIALSNAVHEARQSSEQHYQRHLRNNYFNEDGTPIFKDIPMQRADGSWKSLQVPLISLISTEPLQIQQVCFGFEASIVGAPHVKEGSSSQRDMKITFGGTSNSADTPVYIKVRLGGTSEDPDDEVHISLMDPSCD